MSTPPIPSLKPPDTVQKIRLADVPTLIKKLTGVPRSRKTVYNWASKGRKNYSNETVVLATTSTAGTKYTTKADVLRFLERLEH